MRITQGQSLTPECINYSLFTNTLTFYSSTLPHGTNFVFHCSWSSWTGPWTWIRAGVQIYIIARRAYCVGTSLISLFVRRPSCPSSVVPLSFGPGFCKDACQELDSRSKPGPFGTFCETSSGLQQAEIGKLLNGTWLIYDNICHWRKS